MCDLYFRMAKKHTKKHSYIDSRAYAKCAILYAHLYLVLELILSAYVREARSRSSSKTSGVAFERSLLTACYVTSVQHLH